MPIHSGFDNVKLDILEVLYLDFELNQKQLAMIFDVCIKTIRKQLKKLNILRSRSEAIKLNWQNGQKYNYEKSMPFKSGSEHPQWKGGRHYSKGYILVYTGKKSYTLEHRLIWFECHPETPKSFVVHHLNGIRDDNKIENLIATPKKKHIKDYPNTYIRALQKRIKQLESD